MGSKLKTDIKNKLDSELSAYKTKVTVDSPIIGSDGKAQVDSDGTVHTQSKTLDAYTSGFKAFTTYNDIIADTLSKVLYKYQTKVLVADDKSYSCASGGSVVLYSRRYHIESQGLMRVYFNVACTAALLGSKLSINIVGNNTYSGSIGIIGTGNKLVIADISSLSDDAYYDVLVSYSNTNAPPTPYTITISKLNIEIYDNDDQADFTLS